MAMNEMRTRKAGRAPATRGLPFAALALVPLVLAACSPSTSKAPSASQVAVVASFYPLAYFSQEIGGDRVTVVTLVPPGVEPHDWEPSPRDIATVERASLFVYNGAGFEPWVERVVGNLKSEKLPALDASRGLDLLKSSDGGALDPHLWLAPSLASGQVQRIQRALAQVDPEHAGSYQERARLLTDRLAALDQAYELGLASCRKRTVIASHASLGYLARRYNFEVIPIAGLTPDAEPSPTRIAELVRQARAREVRYILSEKLANPALAQLIAREAGAQTLVFNPLEGLTPKEQEAGESYFTIMEANLANLKLALECQ